VIERRIEVHCGRVFLRVILKGDDSLKGIAEKFRMFLL
jgi:hypothetical protein